MVVSITYFCRCQGYTHPQMTYMGDSFMYMAAALYSNVRTNVQEHFIQMFLRYLTFRFNLKEAKRTLEIEDYNTYNVHFRNFKAFCLKEGSIPPTAFTELEMEVYNEITDILPN